MAGQVPLVGVLALQGDFAEHQQALLRQGLRTQQVRRAADLDGLDALVLPGGESTTMLKLLLVEELFEPLGRTLRSGMPVLATCAGLILLSECVENPQQASFGLLPITVVRNGYGRQYHSGTFALQVDAAHGGALPQELSATFIRAPRITRTGLGCAVLARRDGDPVLVQRGSVLGACFHPELEHDHPVTLHFAAMVRAAAARPRAAALR